MTPAVGVQPPMAMLLVPWARRLALPLTAPVVAMVALPPMSTVEPIATARLPAVIVKSPAICEPAARVSVPAGLVAVIETRPRPLMAVVTKVAPPDTVIGAICWIGPAAETDRLPPLWLMAPSNSAPLVLKTTLPLAELLTVSTFAEFNPGRLMPALALTVSPSALIPLTAPVLIDLPKPLALRVTFPLVLIEELLAPSFRTILPLAVMLTPPGDGAPLAGGREPMNAAPADPPVKVTLPPALSVTVEASVFCWLLPNPTGIPAPPVIVILPLTVRLRLVGLVWGPVRM